jgi:hypothetical protein
MRDAVKDKKDMKKICLKCKRKLLLNCFYKNGGYYRSYCKDCHKKIIKINLYKKYKTYNVRKTPYIINIRIRDKKYQKEKRKLNPIFKKEEGNLYRKKYPERIKANTQLYNSLKRKEIIKEKCRDCERLDTHGHHPDYSKSLEVIWLCPIHHKLEHQK